MENNRLRSNLAAGWLAATLAVGLISCEKPPSPEKGEGQVAQASQTNTSELQQDTDEDDSEFSTGFGECMDAAPADGFPNSNREKCVHEELEKQDWALNAVYRILMSKLDAAEADRVRSAQREWIKMRDAECEPQRANEGAPVAVEVGMCLIKATVARKRHLTEMVPQEGPEE